MDAKRLEHIEELFHEARAREAAERGAFLDGACHGDLELRAQVESLLAHGPDGAKAQPVLEAVDHLRDRGPLQEGPGATIGPYKILQRLGEGGFGVVYMAEQKAPVKRRVALKIIKLGMDTKQVIARFEAERQALALMDHPNIARVFDAGATQTGRPYFVMELVRGVPITEYCDKAGMTTEERLRLFVLVCRAVQHAHQKGIVHRDLKPQNILVTLHDGEPVPKVIDFGIAKATNQELTEKTLFTEFRQFIGTPQYMSPEQAEMSGLDIDTRADVYSLGVLLYELLTGATPVDPHRLRTAGYDEMQRILREEEPVRPSSRLSTMGDEAAVVARRRREQPDHLSRSLRGDLDWIVLKALEKDRSRRYETASAFALDVERHLKHEPVVASPPSRAYRLRKFVRRNRGMVAAVASVFVVLILGAAGTTVGFLEARSALVRERSARTSAEESMQAAIAEAERQRALAHFFESSLLSSGSWSFGSAAPARVVDLLDVAAARLRSPEMSDQPANQAVLAYAIGFAYLERDRWQEALDHFRLAVECVGDGSSDPITLSRASRELDRIDAEPDFDLDVGVDVTALRARALAALEPRVAAGQPEAARALFDWTQVLFLRDLHAEAADLLRELRELVPFPGPPAPSRTLVEFNLACAEARLGKEEEARRLYASASRGLREMAERGDVAGVSEWLDLCQHPAIGMFMDTDPPMQELLELGRTRDAARNLGMAESLWSIAWIGEDVGLDECYEAMRNVVEIARGFEENHLMLGSALVDLAYFDWKRGRTDEVIELCQEARPLLQATRGLPLLRSARLIVSGLVERVAADPGAPDVAGLVRQVEDLVAETGEHLPEDRGVEVRLPWWYLCSDVAHLHRVLAEAGDGEYHQQLAREWTGRLRSDLQPYLSQPLPANHDGRCSDLASGLLLLEDATHEELERARELAERADRITGGRSTEPVDLLSQALFRLGDPEGAVREARRARVLWTNSKPVRGLDERLAHYEEVLAAGR